MLNLIDKLKSNTATLAGFGLLTAIFLLLTVRIFGVFGVVVFYGAALSYLLWRMR